MYKLILIAERDAEHFEIIEDEAVGFYVFRYLNGQNTHDFLQDDIPMAYRCAEEEWGVQATEWHKAAPDQLPLYKQNK